MIYRPKSIYGCVSTFIRGERDKNTSTEIVSRLDADIRNIREFIPADVVSWPSRRAAE